MIKNNAYLQLTSIFLITGTILLYLNHRKIYNIDYSLALISTAIFYVYTAWIFFKTKKTDKIKSNKTFSNTLYANLFYKLILIVGLPVGFYFMVLPENGNFVVPYLMVYLIYMIFETSVLYRKSGNMM
jgi:membrane protease YdiL (CAAX protease family)